MTNVKRIDLGKLEWGVIIGVTGALLTSVFSAGSLSFELKEVSRRVEALEVSAQEAAADKDKSNQRLASIEAKIDFLVLAYGPAADRKRRSSHDD